ncbi:hypothetical protein OHR68_02810 [Spirillospora sp. NBC_00431]
MTEWDEESLARLRSAAHRGDWAAGLEALRDRPLEPVLQYAGDVALLALARDRVQSARLADDCRSLLEGRDGPGDAELAAELAALLGHGPRTELLPLPADLGAVAAAMDGELHVLDLERGDVLAADEVPHETQAAGMDRWLPIPPSGLPVRPDDEDARRGAARRWLAEQGYRPVPRTL